MSVRDHKADVTLHRICVVVVTHNRPELLRRCLMALAQQTIRPDSILVIDNASDDETMDVLAEFPTVLVERLEVNAGGAGGFAAGLRWASDHGFSWAWIMDDDAVPDVGAVEAIDLQARSVPDDVVGLASHLVDPSTTPEPARAGPVRRAHFVGLAVRCSAIPRAGLPRQDFFIYTDDTEYCLRLREGGYKILKVPDSRIEHVDWLQDPSNLAIYLFGRRTVLYPKVVAWRKYYLVRNRILVGHIHGPRRLVVGILQSLGFTTLTLLLAPADIHFAVNGLMDGVRGRSGARVLPPQPTPKGSSAVPS